MSPRRQVNCWWASTRGVIYFARVGRSTIKVGFTESLEIRLPRLARKAGERIKLIATFPGTPAMESKIIWKFRHLIKRGREWMRVDEELLEFIEAAVAVGRLPRLPAAGRFTFERYGGKPRAYIPVTTR